MYLLFCTGLYERQQAFGKSLEHFESLQTSQFSLSVNILEASLGNEKHSHHKTDFGSEFLSPKFHIVISNEIVGKILDWN